MREEIIGAAVRVVALDGNFNTLLIELVTRSTGLLVGVLRGNINNRKEKLWLKKKSTM